MKSMQVKTNTVETDGQTYEVDKITYNMVDGENKYDEMSESVDIMGNRQSTTVMRMAMSSRPPMQMAHTHLPITMIKTVLLQKLTNLGMQLSKHMIRMELGFLKEATSLHPLSQTDINTVTAVILIQ